MVTARPGLATFTKRVPIPPSMAIRREDNDGSSKRLAFRRWVSVTLVTGLANAPPSNVTRTVARPRTTAFPNPDPPTEVVRPPRRDDPGRAAVAAVQLAAN